jgi:indole-3-glycerol phosphate synthase
VTDSVLDAIVASVSAGLGNGRPSDDLVDRARQAVEQRRAEGLRSLRSAVGTRRPAVIAECKKASPSAGLLRRDFDPVELARRYAAGGAAAISVVTEPQHFQGRLEWVTEVRQAVDLPVLRKDFIISDRQLYETVVAGADAVLLIQRILDAGRLARLMSIAADLHLEVLLEVFADEDPQPAVATGAGLIGVNARDLATFAIDLDRAVAVARSIPCDRLRIAESGIRDRADLLLLHGAGYDGFLVGEHLVRADDSENALRRLLGEEEERGSKS